MANGHSIWEHWAKFFVQRSNRELPALEQDMDYSGLPASLAHSLAIFQLGESGGGTIIRQSPIDGTPLVSNARSPQCRGLCRLHCRSLQ